MTIRDLLVAGVKPNLFIRNILLVLSSMISINAGEIGFSLNPPFPLQADPVNVTVSRDFPTPCYSTAATFTRNGRTINLLLSTNPTFDICPGVIAPQTTTVNFGSLPPGLYQINLTWRGTPGKELETATHVFEVFSQAPGLTVVTGEPVTVTFPGLSGKSYQLQWSPDLRRWFDLSEPTLGKNQIITIPDPEASSTPRFYRTHETTLVRPR